jgi:hypothetical protein
MGKTLPAQPGRWLWLVVAAAIVVVVRGGGDDSLGGGDPRLVLADVVAGAVVFSAGLVVPWAVNRRDQLAGQQAAAVEEAARVEDAIRTVMRPLSAPESPDGGETESLIFLSGLPGRIIKRQLAGVCFLVCAASCDRSSSTDDRTLTSRP